MVAMRADSVGHMLAVAAAWEEVSMARVEDPVILALDTGDRDRLLRLAEGMRGEVRTVKIGLEAYTRCGPEIILTMRDFGYRVFADLKLHDIPNTVRGAAAALSDLGVEMISVHVSGGRKMLEAAVEAAREAARAGGGRPPLLLGVTVLTSLEEAAMREMGWQARLEDVVLGMASLGRECGLDGFVCSPRELTVLRGALGDEPVLVTPGIRLPGTEVHDQARTATPREALRAGADYLVVGRAVTSQADPRGALRSLRASMRM